MADSNSTAAPTGSKAAWSDLDEQVAVNSIEFTIREHGEHLNRREQARLADSVLTDLRARKRDTMDNVWLSAQIVAERLCKDVDVVAELAKLAERLADKARSDLLTGHVARVVRALHLSAANIRAAHGIPAKPNAQSVHRKTLDGLSRSAWQYAALARSSWAGVEPAMRALGEDEPLGEYGLLTPAECERWAEAKRGEDEAYLQGCLDGGRSVPADPHAVETEVLEITGRVVTRPARAWLWIDSFVSLLISNGIGVMDDAHREYSSDELKAEARQAVAELGPKEATYPRAIMRAILRRFGSEAVTHVFRARDRVRSHEKRLSKKVAKAL